MNLTMLRKISAAILFAGSLLAQSPEFDVAAIKPAAPQEIGRISTRMSTDTDTGSLVYSNVNLKDMLGRAFRVQQYQISGPNSIESERFDVSATFRPGVTPEQVSQMLQALLADRFKLKIHRETKELPAYLLTVAKNGPKLKPSESDGDVATNSSGKAWHLTAKVTMRRLAEILTEQAGRPVLDHTDLAGSFDLKLDWTSGEASDAEIPSIFTALQDQLGLKLESTKAPVQSIVVDHVERTPTEN
ncbi:MAG: TIGR03435 family protein [Bryobacteraceae bacterium]